MIELEFLVEIMEVRKEITSYSSVPDKAQRESAYQNIASEPLTRAYVPAGTSSSRKRREAREISFFGHLAVYSLIMMLLFSICMAVLPAIVAIPLGLALPIGIILGSKRLYGDYLKPYFAKRLKK